jgi:hypothetical protein
MLFYPGGIAMPGGSFAAAKHLIVNRFAPPQVRDRQLKGICPDYRESAGDWSVASFEALKSQIESQVPTRARDRALKRIANLDPSKPLAGEEAMKETWNCLARSPPAPTVFYKQNAETLVNIGCGDDGGSYVITGLLNQLAVHNRLGCSDPAVVAAAFLDEAHCPAARDVREGD